MLVDPIVDIFKYSPFAGSGSMGSISGNSGMKIFDGRVLDNADDRFIGRVKCQVHGLLPFDDPDKLPWIYPIDPIGDSQLVPEVESHCAIIFPYNSIYFGFYIGKFRNRAGRTVDFQSHYPEKYGFKDSAGHSIMVDKSKKTVEVRFPDNAALNYDSVSSVVDYSDDYGNFYRLDRKNSSAIFFIAGAEIKINKGDVSIEINKVSLVVKTLFKAVMREGMHLTTPVFKLLCRLFGLQTEIIHITEDEKFETGGKGNETGVDRV